MSEKVPDTPIDPDRLERQLALVVSSRVGEDQIAWTIFGIFWAAQVLLVGVLLQGPEFPPHPGAGIIVSSFGVVMSVAWALTQSRSLQHLKRFEELTKDLENALHDAGHLKKDHQLTMARRFAGTRARDVMRACSWGAAIAWGVGIVVFLYCACTCGSSC